ncbi:MAG: tyrosine-protein phosphatase [Bacilli bacterium]|nr:tyrosine-protein phosphatase [Bacilli bacterium]
MKKKIFCFLALGALLATGCGEKTQTPNSNTPGQDTPAKPDYTKLFNLNSPEDPVCMVNEKVKEYTDAIYAQRDAAGASASSEDKIVDPLYSNKVQVAASKGDYDENVPVELSFTVDDSIKNETFTVEYWVEGKEDDVKKVVPNDGKVSLQNLYRSTRYEWHVVASSGKESKIETFETGDYVRFLNVGSIPNFRDNGGWTTVDGKRVKQGLVYRGFELNDHKLKNGHAQNVMGDDDPGKDVFVKDLGIRAEIDLRSEDEADKITKCAMNKEGVTESDPEFVSYERIKVGSYATGLKENKAQYKTIFEDYLANADQKPVYYHCYGGADRTGTIGFMLGAILGMSYTDLIIDYEATTFSNNLKEHDKDSDQYTHFPAMLEEIKSWSFYSESKPLSEIMETYLTQSCGVASEKIQKIKDIMLEDID